MSRNISAGMLTAIGGRVVTPVILADFDFTAGVVYVWGGYGDLVFGGNTYQGIGDFGNVSEPEESTDLSSRGVTVSLSGIPSAYISVALGTGYQGRRARIWFGAIDSAGALISTPYLMFSGRMDTMIINDGGETATVSLTLENRLVDLSRTRERRYTHQDQQLDYPGDKFFEFVNALQGREIKWGVPYSSDPGINGNRGGPESGGPNRDEYSSQ